MDKIKIEQYSEKDATQLQEKVGLGEVEDISSSHDESINADKLTEEKKETFESKEKSNEKNERVGKVSVRLNARWETAAGGYPRVELDIRLAPDNWKEAGWVQRDFTIDITKDLENLGLGAESLNRLGTEWRDTREE